VRSQASADPGDFDHRIQLLIHGEQIFQAIGFDYGCIEAAIAIGLVKRQRADLHGALASLRHAASVMRRSGWEHSSHSFDCHLACGEILYEMNQIAAARDELQIAIRAHQFSDSTATTHLARLMFALCDAAESGPGFSPADNQYQAENESDDVWVDIVATANPLIMAHAGWHRIRRDLRPEMPAPLWIAVLSGRRRCSAPC